LIPYITAGLFLAGVAQALYLRKTNPLKYETIGHVAMGEDGLGPRLDAVDITDLSPVELGVAKALGETHGKLTLHDELELERELEREQEAP
ncbi:hypothetical protein, partial [Arthrobacter sp. GN70]|uniref:hypothetical protein n=1 Tax=Arthrobacter sp. GN70 TaxID=2838876 RepID=UPI001BFE38AE